MASVETEAWELMEAALVRRNEEPIGTVAANPPDGDGPALNYDEVFMRDFAVSAVALLLRGEHSIVRSFLRTSATLQSKEQHFDCFHAARGMLPASFKLLEGSNGREQIVPDYGNRAIGRVTPMDSAFWWLYVLHAYTRASGDEHFAQTAEIQETIRLILQFALTPGHELTPTLLVPDGAFMIDRRMGVYGHPLEIQTLFFLALRSAENLLTPGVDGNDELLRSARLRQSQLVYHLRTFYWLDLPDLNRIYRFNVEEFGENAANRFNIYPSTIPQWLFEWLPREAGYFLGNLGPSRIDFRVFAQGNFLAVISGLAAAPEAAQITRLFHDRHDFLVGEMPLKLVYPALEKHDWFLLTGSDPKNSPWSYHNGGNWPFLLWIFTAACLRTGQTDGLHERVERAGERLAADGWPEYYDGRSGRLIGKEARMYQTWSIAGYLAARQLLDNPEQVDLFTFEDTVQPTACEL